MPNQVPISEFEMMGRYVTPQLRRFTDFLGQAYNQYAPRPVKEAVNYFNETPDPIPDYMAPQLGPGAYIDNLAKGAITLANPKNIERLKDALQGASRITKDPRALALAYAAAKHPKLMSLPEKFKIPRSESFEGSVATLQGLQGGYNEKDKILSLYEPLIPHRDLVKQLATHIDTITHELTHAAQFERKKAKRGFPFNIIGEADKPYVNPSDYQDLIEKAQSAGRPLGPETKKLLQKSFFDAYEAQPIEVRARMAGKTGKAQFLKFLESQLNTTPSPEKEITPEVWKDIATFVAQNREKLEPNSPKHQRRLVRSVLTPLHQLEHEKRKKPGATYLDKIYGFPEQLYEHTIPWQVRDNYRGWGDEFRKFLQSKYGTVKLVPPPSSRSFGIELKPIDLSPTISDILRGIIE